VNRGYVDRVEKKFEPTDLGFVVVDLLKEYFPDIVDVDFTAGMENRLDDIAEGERTRSAVLSDFYQPFASTLASAEEQIGHVELPVEVSDIQCENCGQFMVVKQGRFGNFLACPGFPACRNTKPILKETGVNCPKCQSAIVERRTKRGKVFFGCSSYPACDFTTWDTPLKDTCAECGSFKVKHNFRKDRFAIWCSNEACSTRKTTPAAAAPIKTATPKKAAASKKAAAAQTTVASKKTAPQKKAVDSKKPATKKKTATKKTDGGNRG